MSVLHCSPLRPRGKIRRHFAEDFISVDNKRLRMTDVITWETLDSFSPHRFIAFSRLRSLSGENTFFSLSHHAALLFRFTLEEYGEKVQPKYKCSN